MSGPFELLIILLFIAAAAFDAMKRNRQRQQRQEEMEAQEAATAEAEGSSARQRAERLRRAGSGQPESTDAVAEPEPTETEARRSAEELVPEDLWAILTGQVPPSRSPESSGETAEAEEPPAQPHIPTPVPSDRSTSGTRDTAPEPRSRSGQEHGVHEEPTRRSSRWMKGVGAEAERKRVAAEEAAAFGTLEEPWDRFEDITAGEIADGEGKIQGAVESVSPYAKGRRAVARRGVGRGQYTRLLETGSLEDLRKAVVLREVLGRPVGFRDPEEDRFP